MRKGLLLFLLIQGCKETTDIPPLNSSLYHQQEDSVISELGGQVLGNKNHVIPYYKSINLMNNMGFPLRLGTFYRDSTFDRQRDYALLEASHIVRSHNINPDFVSLLIRMWDKQDAVNKLVRPINYPVLAARLALAVPLYHRQLYSAFEAPSAIPSHEWNESNKLSRVCFNKTFTLAAFQVSHSSLSGGFVYLYCIERRAGKWTIVAKETINSWKY